MPEADARARIAAQADDDARRAAADVWLDNEATTEALRAQVLRLWHERIEPFELNLRHGIRSRLSHPTLSAPDPHWPVQAARLLARIRHAVGDAAVTLDHIGSTAVPGLVAKDVVDLMVGVASLDDADDPGFVASMDAAGFVRMPGEWHDNGKDGTTWPKRFHGVVRPRAGGPRARARGRLTRVGVGAAVPRLAARGCRRAGRLRHDEDRARHRGRLDRGLRRGQGALVRRGGRARPGLGRAHRLAATDLLTGGPRDPPAAPARYLRSPRRAP